MTTFERFQRDARSRMNSDMKSLKRKSSVHSDTNLHNLLNFSAREIVFLHHPNQKIATFSLRITNLTGHRVHFKVRSNNSIGYLVSPYEQVISDKAEMQIRFQFMPSNEGLSAHLRDKFEIIWGKVPYKPGEPTSLTESKIFPVIIQRADGYSERESNSYINERQFMVGGRKEESPQRPLVDQNNAPLPKADTLLTKNNIILVSAVSFVMGFLLT